VCVFPSVAELMSLGDFLLVVARVHGSLKGQAHVGIMSVAVRDIAGVHGGVVAAVRVVWVAGADVAWVLLLEVALLARVANCVSSLHAVCHLEVGLLTLLWEQVVEVARVRLGLRVAALHLWSSLLLGPALARVNGLRATCLRDWRRAAHRHKRILRRGRGWLRAHRVLSVHAVGVEELVQLRLVGGHVEVHSSSLVLEVPHGSVRWVEHGDLLLHRLGVLMEVLDVLEIA